MEYFGTFLSIILGILVLRVGCQVFPTPAVDANNPAIRYSQILKELADVTQGRQALSARLQQYRETFDNYKSQVKQKKDNCACYNSSTIAFNAHLNKDVAVLGKNQPIPFDNVTLNAGGCYDKRHSQFRAPVSGSYQFFVSLTSRSGYTIAADVLQNNDIVLRLRTGNSGYVHSAANEFVVHMNDGDDIWVQHSNNITDSNRIYNDEGLFTTFSGYLVARD